jgi:hypothetical protein
VLLHPYRFDHLTSLDDLALVRLARAALSEGEPGRETAKRCVGLVVLRQRDLVRAVIAAKVPPGAIDDVESDVLLRFSRKVYSGDQITNPVGLLVRMAMFCRADFHADRPAPESSLGEWDDASADAALDDLVVTAAVDELLAPLGERQRDVVWRRTSKDDPAPRWRRCFRRPRATST